MTQPGKRFVLKRLKWAGSYHDRKLFRQPGEVAVASFATLEEAERESAKRENEFRKKVNPFDCGAAVHYWTHLDEPRLRDWLMDHGIDPPKEEGAAHWPAWWKKNRKKLGPAKCATVWEVLDKVRFFVVREEPVRPVGYALVAVDWQFNDEYYDADAECGHFLTVYRSRERAEIECERRNEESRAEWGDASEESEGEFDLDNDAVAFNYQPRLARQRGVSEKELKRGEGLFSSSARVPFFEVIEIELEGIQ